MFSVDLNSDIGESFGAYKLGDDDAILQHITACNVACGWHAGDPMVMDRVVRVAAERGVAVGAHPGYPDLMGFGRRVMKLSFAEAKNYVKYQLGALSAFTTTYGTKIHHCAPHGAMGNMCQDDRDLARAICEAVYEIDPEIIIYYCAGAVLGEEAEKIGLRAACEIFADRAYEDDLSLRSRKLEGSMITDEDVAIARCIRMIKEGKVTSYSGKELDIKGDTLCVHGDGPKAIAFVKRISEAFTKEGIEIKAF
ncbi:MAG: 5-oxoprolinase subunit PxpA [Lachnospiraceae bacterium]|nr:5-oxoprolinase subunit PxpA [Lachnospiraceae bacterium]